MIRVKPRDTRRMRRGTRPEARQEERRRLVVPPPVSWSKKPLACSTPPWITPSGRCDGGRAPGRSSGRVEMAEAAQPAVSIPPDAVEESVVPERAQLVLLSLILVAAVANLNLAVANVALPDISLHFGASQTQLDLVAVGYSLGLAASVLYLGAIGDRYGRKMLLVLGVTLSVPACLLAAWAPSVEVLVLARIFGGLAAGMAYPTTLALITALWAGPPRTKSIALWSAGGGAIAALGPLLSGLALEHFWWGSVF